MSRIPAEVAEDVRAVELALLGDKLARVRLCEPAALAAMRRALERDGQLCPITAYQSAAELEVIDGFKRLRAAQSLGWRQLRTRVVDVDPVEAKLLLVVLHAQRGLCELEEGWLVRSLVRDDGLPQSAVAARLGRHKSWVCRRLLLVEALDATVQADVRLGLLAPRAAVALSALPRGNQVAAAALVMRRGLTVRQTEQCVAELGELGGDGARAAEIARRMAAGTGTRLGAAPPRRTRSEADWIAGDVMALLRLVPRLEARLLATALGAHGAPAAEVILEGLTALGPVLAALGRTVAMVLGQERAA